MSFVRQVLNRTVLKNKLFIYRAALRLERPERVPFPAVRGSAVRTKSSTHLLVVIPSKHLSFAHLFSAHDSLPTLD
jgi:hypothetical protein